MSYDVSLQVHSGPGATVTAFDDNYTSNTACMWREAGCDLAAFDGKPAIELRESLQLAIADLTARESYFRTMEPANGWGDFEGTLRFLTEICEACGVHQFAVVRVWR